MCQPESRELLTFCVKKIKGLTKVKLVDAGFVWTEPHSRRLKVKLTVQKEVFIYVACCDPRFIRISRFFIYLLLFV